MTDTAQTAQPEQVDYVLMVVMDPSNKQFIGLLKGKGPAHLIGKLTFPGGKLEPGESVAAGASRELLEETGVLVPEDQWRCHLAVAAPSYNLSFAFAASPDVHKAQTMEAESVFVMNLDATLKDLAENPHRYVGDFSDILRLAPTYIAAEQ